MNSVSMPRRPVARARSARSLTVLSTVAMGAGPSLRPPRTAARRGAGAAGRVAGVGVGARGAVRLGARGRLGRRLVGPVAVPGVELARGVLRVALAVAVHADAEEEV